jgi:hypothetical protein
MKKPTPRRIPRQGAAASGAAEVDAAAQLNGFLEKYDPKIAALGRKALAMMRRRLPGAIELIYDNYNALVIGFSAVDKVSATPFSIALYPRWITLFFLQGAALPDPKRLLQGEGAIVRSIRIEDAKALAATFANEDVDALISAGVLHTGWMLDPKAKKGRMIIKSISPSQRPRRP